MPLYQYECAGGHAVELLQKLTDSDHVACPVCGDPARRVLASRIMADVKGEATADTAEKQILKLAEKYAPRE